MKHWKYSRDEGCYYSTSPEATEETRTRLFVDYDGECVFDVGKFPQLLLSPESLEEAAALIRRHKSTGYWAPKPLTADAIAEYFSADAGDEHGPMIAGEIDGVEVFAEYWSDSPELAFYAGENRVCIVDLDDPETALEVLCVLFALDLEEVRAEIEQ